MNKIQKDLQKAFKRVNKLCIFLNKRIKDLYFELLDKNQEEIPLHQKARNNTIIGRRGDLPALSSRMGITIKVTNKKTDKYILLEPRINTPSKNHFKATYLKGISGDQSDIIFLDTTAIFIVDSPNPEYFAIYEYSQIPQKNIIKGNKGRGNAKRVNLNNINVTPVPIQGSKGPLGEPGLQDVIMELIQKIGK